MSYEKGIQCDACAWSGPVSPGPFIAQAMVFPSDLLTSFGRSSLAFFQGSRFSSLHLYGCLVCK